jgi:hypothetical protein
MFIQTLKHIRFTGLEHPSLASTLRQPESFQLYPDMCYHHFRGYDNTKCIRKESPSLGEERQPGVATYVAEVAISQPRRVKFRDAVYFIYP